nr:MAG TPA: hypothetical protein [Caudoviricetes sp.]
MILSVSKLNQQPLNIFPIVSRLGRFLNSLDALAYALCYSATLADVNDSLQLSTNITLLSPSLNILNRCANCKY